MTVVSGALRLLLVMLTIVVGALACGFAGVLGRAAFEQVAMRWHRAIVYCFGVRIRHRGVAHTRGALLFSNHISWLDISVFGSCWPVTFLGNSDIARWPLLGWVIQRGGTLFIKRGSGAQKAIRETGHALAQGRSVVLFPEGKTTDGRSVIRFQPRLAQAAIDAGAPVQPAAVRYLDASGARVVRHSFAGNISLVGSAWKTACGPRIIAEITLFAPLTGSQQRQELAMRAEQLVRGVVETGSEHPGNRA